jgi:hypothetical protein
LRPVSFRWTPLNLLHVEFLHRGLVSELLVSSKGSRVRMIAERQKQCQGKRYASICTLNRIEQWLCRAVLSGAEYPEWRNTLSSGLEGVARPLISRNIAGIGRSRS